MKKFIKWGLHIVGALVIVGAILAAFNWERLVRLYNVNTLFDEANIIRNFSNMKEMFFSTPIPNARTSQSSNNPVVALEPLPKTFTFNGESKELQKRLDDFATTSLLVMRGNTILHETYSLGTKKDDKRISWSVAKSFLSAMFGIAVGEGKIDSIDDLVTKYVPAFKGSAYEGVKIRDVLTMSSGVKFDENYLDFDSDINRMGRTLALGGSMDEFATSIKATAGDAGVARIYVSIDTHVLAMVLRAATGKSLPQYLSEKIWNKVGSKSELYYLTDGDGVSFALGGLNLTTRDYARFGQLFLNNGKWNGEQIIPQDWVKESISVSAPPPADKDDPLQYGYQWWMPPATDDEYFAVGIYGQYIYINPKANMMVVKTAADRNFRADGQKGKIFKLENIAMFRAMAEHYSDWKYPGDK